MTDLKECLAMDCEKCTTVGDCEGLKKKIIRLNKLLIENVCRKCNWLDGNGCAKIRCDIKEELGEVR